MHRNPAQNWPYSCNIWDILMAKLLVFTYYMWGCPVYIEFRPSLDNNMTWWMQFLVAAKKVSKALLFSILFALTWQRELDKAQISFCLSVCISVSLSVWTSQRAFVHHFMHLYRICAPFGSLCTTFIWVYTPWCTTSCESVSPRNVTIWWSSYPKMHDIGDPWYRSIFSFWSYFIYLSIKTNNISAFHKCNSSGCFNYLAAQDGHDMTTLCHTIKPLTCSVYSS